MARKTLAMIYKENGNELTLEHNADNVGFVDWHKVESRLNISKGNDKVGNMLNISFPIHYTCSHCALCYKRKECYGLNGCFCYMDNQIRYAENHRFFLENTVEDIVKAMKAVIRANKAKFFRWFAIGDIANNKVLDVMKRLAEECEDVKFYAYTKKHELVNRYIDKVGTLPNNLNILFSLWTDESGKIQQIDNPHNLTTTAFIPCGKEEELITDEMFICPCSNPNWIGHCTDCHGCPYNEHKTIAFLEHSTTKTKKRDKAIKEAREANKKAKRGIKTA